METSSHSGTGSKGNPIMETDQLVAPTLKRVFLDEEDRTLDKSKKVKLDLNTLGDKKTILSYIIDLCVTVCSALKIDAKMMYLEIPSMQIFHVAFCVHQVKRMSLTKTESARLKNIKANVQNYTVMGINHTFQGEELLAIWETLQKKADYPADIIAKSHTMMCLFELFRERLRELRVGPDVFVISKNKETNEIRQRTCSTLGVPTNVRHMLTGIGWDLQVRGTLSKYTSALCQAAILSNGKKDQYSEKIRTSVERGYGFVPNIRKISEFIEKNNIGTNKPIMTKLALISTIHGDKSKRRASFPVSFLFKHCTKLEAVEGASTINTLEEKFDDFGFSSKKAALLYQIHGRRMYVPKVDKVKARQIMFHSIFGTGSEDQGILSKITNEAKFMTRESFDADFFKLFFSSGDMDNIEGIRLIYFAKSIESAQCRWLNTGTESYGSYSAFSGFRIKLFSESFREFVSASDARGDSIRLDDVTSVVKSLDKTVNLLSNKIKEAQDNKQDIVFGTTKWRRVETAGFTKEFPGEEVEEKFQETGITFWSN
uniref:NP n=1 Tax=Bemisia tabaci Quaranja-like virus 1 TaxID=2840014 RepID=A0A8E8FU70_9ORTO|nr:NP [Bemisia tabaci Quaranja-like virus 1]